jgi:hypothetical protein
MEPIMSKMIDFDSINNAALRSGCLFVESLLVAIFAASNIARSNSLVAKENWSIGSKSSNKEK